MEGRHAETAGPRVEGRRGPVVGDGRNGAAREVGGDRDGDDDGVGRPGETVSARPIRRARGPLTVTRSRNQSDPATARVLLDHISSTNSGGHRDAMQGRRGPSVAAMALVTLVASAASLPSAAAAASGGGLLTRTDLRLPWKSPLGPLGKAYKQTTATTPATATGPGPTGVRPRPQQQQQHHQTRWRPTAPTGAAARPARGPAAAYAPTARPTANATAAVPSTTGTPRPKLESTTHDRAIIMAPLNRCPEGQRMGPDRHCRPNYTDPEDEAD